VDVSSTIAAISTPAGAGGIAVVRVSGAQAIAVADQIFSSHSGKTLAQQPSATLRYGKIAHRGELLDEALVSVFRAPASYTGEDLVEISCHGSPYIQQQVVQALIACGARLAQAGEFTMRAFLNGKIDLAQAEAVGDLIASQSRAMHRVAMQQMRGGYSDSIKSLREKLLHFASMLELELDFGEEDVELANRDELKNLLRNMLQSVSTLTRSFELGNAIKNGVHVAIAGSPNVGKSTLLNALLRDERALVSDVAGTTRDAIEDCTTIGGVLFRFIDTAGIRHSADHVEQLGIARSYQKLQQAQVVLLVLDATWPEDALQADLAMLLQSFDATAKHVLVLLNKSDCVRSDALQAKLRLASPQHEALPISAKTGDGIAALEQALLRLVALPDVADASIVSNLRHYEALTSAQQSLERAQDCLAEGRSEDLTAFEIREAATSLAAIVGEIGDAEILDNIFSRFCIGK
jgi:tRNA modification GTPase